MTTSVIDITVHDWFVAHRVSWLDTSEKILTQGGSSVVILAVTLLFAGWLRWREHKSRAALYLAVTLVASSVLVFLVKVIVRRERPPASMWLTTEEGYSLPSGHATLSAALATGLVILALREVRKLWIKILAGWAIAFAFLVGLSRIYLGVHWITDVLIGWGLGLTVATLSSLAVFARTVKDTSARRVEKTPSELSL